MINWNQFYANGGYNGECDPQCYDREDDEEYDEELLLDEEDVESYNDI